MKKLMITGGLIGFAMATLIGLAQDSSSSSILWRACVAAVAAGFLMRWWGQVWIKGLTEAYQEKLAAAAALEQQRAQKSR